ncbi:17327_t:CDS:2 [Acaulospora colombiana]|uniref:17327_t:CDS:1 n=1 Tax=Acaulospora colombiana TaxID=27376 RepID=A0ACA9LED5_9GLOM|nr:17327_t:CDS:2 [Acaulospora colombiana]
MPTFQWVFTGGPAARPQNNMAASSKYCSMFSFPKAVCRAKLLDTPPGGYAILHEIKKMFSSGKKVMVKLERLRGPLRFPLDENGFGLVHTHNQIPIIMHTRLWIGIETSNSLGQLNKILIRVIKAIEHD